MSSSRPALTPNLFERWVEDELARALEAAGDATEGDDDESEPDVLFRFMNAVNTLYAGQNEESIPAFDLIIRVHPEMPRAYYYRGVAFYRSELNDQAMADFVKSIELDPESGDTYLQRGLLHHDTGDKQAALDDFNTAIDLAPWLADAYRNRGTLLLNNGQAAPGRARPRTCVGNLPLRAKSRACRRGSRTT